MAGAHRLTERGARRRLHIMETATTLFVDKGYHATSVADIVRAEACGKGVFYWYFDSKSDLFAEILREAMAAFRRAQGDAIAAAATAFARLERGVRASMRFQLDHRELFGLMEMAAADDAFRGLLRKGRERIVADTIRHIKDGIVEGEVRDADPETLAHCILGVTTHLMRAMIHREMSTAAEDELIEEAVRFTLGGLTV